PVPGRSRVVWMEVANASDGELSPAAHARVEAWRGAGHSVEARSVSGPAFWQTQEIAECPELIEETLAALTALRP
ncbi:MAG TPA: hydrolase 2, exosortase A system-associated, partial [Casimicrobiaceae bacterium]